MTLKKSAARLGRQIRQSTGLPFAVAMSLGRMAVHEGGTYAHLGYLSHCQETVHAALKGVGAARFEWRGSIDSGSTELIELCGPKGSTTPETLEQDAAERRGTGDKPEPRRKVKSKNSVPRRKMARNTIILCERGIYSPLKAKEWDGKLGLEKSAINLIITDLRQGSVPSGGTVHRVFSWTHGVAKVTFRRLPMGDCATLRIFAQKETDLPK